MHSLKRIFCYQIEDLTIYTPMHIGLGNQSVSVLIAISRLHYKFRQRVPEEKGEGSDYLDAKKFLIHVHMSRPRLDWKQPVVPPLEAGKLRANK